MKLLASLLLFSSVAYADPAAKPDKDMQKVLDTLASLGPKPIETLTPDDARKQPSPADAVKKLHPQPEQVANVQDLSYNGAAGDKLALRVYTPKGKGPMPIIVYFHGGGWVVADLDTYDAAPRSLANQTGAIVVSVEYRKAPEHKFPAAHDDAYAAFKWVEANASSFGGDPDRVAVAGESAGANLAINVAIKARDEKAAKIAYMLLVYPVAGKDMTTPSYTANADAKPLSKPAMQWFVKQTFAKPEQAADPRIDLVNRTDLAGLPAATVVTAEIDPLRSEGQALAAKLKSAGVKVDALDVKGVTHEFFGMGAVVDKAKSTLATSAKDVKGALSNKPAAR